jgi:hypothetical protein
LALPTWLTPDKVIGRDADVVVLVVVAVAVDVVDAAAIAMVIAKVAVVVDVAAVGVVAVVVAAETVREERSLGLRLPSLAVSCTPTRSLRSRKFTCIRSPSRRRTSSIGSLERRSRTR